MGYFYILSCIAFTVYGQIVLKWRMNMQNELPAGLLDKGIALTKLIFTDPFIFSGFSAAFLASLFWMAAMSKFSISFAYPFMSLAFVFVMFGSAVFLGESLNPQKFLGTVIIVTGLVVLSKA